MVTLQVTAELANIPNNLRTIRQSGGFRGTGGIYPVTRVSPHVPHTEPTCAERTLRLEPGEVDYKTLILFLQINNMREILSHLLITNTK